MKRMKKLLLTLVSSALLISSSIALADDAPAKLRLHISGATNNTYFLCISTMGGCVSILAGDKGDTYPMRVGLVEDIGTIDGATEQVQMQPTPASCKLTVKQGQVLTVSGKLAPTKNNSVY